MCVYGDNIIVLGVMQAGFFFSVGDGGPLSKKSGIDGGASAQSAAQAALAK